MLKRIFNKHSESLPKSPTSMPINLIATVVFLFSLLAIRKYDIEDIEAAILAMTSLALTVIILEFIFLKPFKRPSTGLNFKQKNPVNLKRVTIGIIGLYSTIGFVALIYWLFPFYYSGFYEYWVFIKYIALILLIGGIPYFIILDKYLIEPCDSYWHFGMFILGQWQKCNFKTVKQHVLGWLIKMFFLPLMFTSLVNDIRIFKGADFTLALSYFPYTFDFLNNLIFSIDLAFISVGYLMTMRIFDSHIRTAEPTFLGWAVTLQCYQPFWDFSYDKFLQYEDGIYWGNLFSSNDTLYFVWGSAILFLLLIYVWASIVFGLRFSNLTNRGILTNGPYRFCMHPAYVSKNLAWWLISVPFLSQAGFWEAVRHSIQLLILNLIYYVRAITEERHLSQDPNYVKYGLEMNKRSIFRVFYKIFPFLKYDPQKYLGKLEDLSTFLETKTRPTQSLNADV